MLRVRRTAEPAKNRRPIRKRRGFFERQAPFPGAERLPDTQRRQQKGFLDVRGRQQREHTNRGGAAKRKAAAQAAQRSSERVLFHSILCVGLGKRLVSGLVASVFREKGSFSAVPRAFRAERAKKGGEGEFGRRFSNNPAGKSVNCGTIAFS